MQLISKLAKKETDAYGMAGAIAEEILSSVRTVVSFGGESKEIDRYKENLVLAKNNNIKRSFLTGIGFGLLWFFIYSTYALAFWYGVKLVIEEKTMPSSERTYDAGNMVTVISCLSSKSQPFKNKILGFLQRNDCQHEFWYVFPVY